MLTLALVALALTGCSCVLAFASGRELADFDHALSGLTMALPTVF